MIEPTAVTLIEPLIRATEAGTVKWSEDPTGGYEAQIGENTVNIYTTFVESQGVKHPAVNFRILDKSGNPVDWASFVGPQRLEVHADRLFILAQRQVRNVDSVLTDILARLETAHGSTH